MSRIFLGKRLLVLYLILVCFGLVAGAQQANRQENERGLRVTTFGKNRPKSQSSESVQGPRLYKPAESPASPGSASADGESMVGITIWRLRGTSSSDDKEARILEHRASKVIEWIPERVDASTPIGEGQRVRLSIETPGTGHLYVIDREKYADGKMGDAALIFPTMRTRGGNNRVAAGRVVEIPAQGDNPPYFTLSRSRTDHVAELLTVLVTPEPLDGVTVGDEATRINEAELALWEKKWGRTVERIDLEGGAGRSYTKEEKLAGADSARLLTQGDPLPQTIYRVKAKPGDPLLVTIQLSIK